MIALFDEMNLGDDCISIESGSQKLKITNITCGPGHGIRYIQISLPQSVIVSILLLITAYLYTQFFCSQHMFLYFVNPALEV